MMQQMKMQMAQQMAQVQALQAMQAKAGGGQQPKAGGPGYGGGSGELPGIVNRQASYQGSAGMINKTSSMNSTQSSNATAVQMQQMQNMKNMMNKVEEPAIGTGFSARIDTIIMHENMYADSKMIVRALFLFGCSPSKTAKHKFIGTIMENFKKQKVNDDIILTGMVPLMAAQTTQLFKKLIHDEVLLFYVCIVRKNTHALFMKVFVFCLYVYSFTNIFVFFFSFIFHLFFLHFSSFFSFIFHLFFSFIFHHFFIHFPSFFSFIFHLSLQHFAGHTH